MKAALTSQSAMDREIPTLKTPTTRSRQLGGSPSTSSSSSSSTVARVPTAGGTTLSRFANDLQLLKNQTGGISATLIPALSGASGFLSTHEIVTLIISFKRVGDLTGVRESWEERVEFLKGKFGTAYLGNITPPTTAGFSEEERRGIQTASSGRKTPAQATLDMVIEVGEIIQKWLLKARLPEDTLITAGTVAWALEEQFKSYAISLFDEGPNIKRQVLAYPVGSTAGCRLESVQRWSRWFFECAVMCAAEVSQTLPYKQGDPQSERNWGSRDELLTLWAEKKVPPQNWDQMKAQAEIEKIKWTAKPESLSTAAQLQILFLFSPRHLLFCRQVRLALANRQDAGISRVQALEAVTEYIFLLTGLENYLLGTTSTSRPTYVGSLKTWNRLRNYFATVRTFVFGGATGRGGNPRKNIGLVNELDEILARDMDEEVFGQLERIIDRQARMNKPNAFGGRSNRRPGGKTRINVGEEEEESLSEGEAEEMIIRRNADV